jgi:hypothetical protein
MFGQPPLCSNPFFSLDVRDLEVLDPDDTPRDLILSRALRVKRDSSNDVLALAPAVEAFERLPTADDAVAFASFGFPAQLHPIGVPPACSSRYHRASSPSSTAPG